VVPVDGVSLADAETALDDALAQFMTDGVDPDQLDRIKLQLRAAQIYERDNVGGIANRYGQALTTSLTVEDVQAWPEVLQSVTADDIMAAAALVLRPEPSVTGWLMRGEAPEGADVQPVAQLPTQQEVTQ
jgi:zinc protease